LDQAAGALVLFQQSDAVTALVERIRGEHARDSSANYCGFAIALIQCANQSDASRICRHWENTGARHKGGLPNETLKVAFFICFSEPSLLSDIGGAEPDERATFVPAQDAEFFNERPKFIAEYAD
jgi:hypothetical protein